MTLDEAFEACKIARTYVEDRRRYVEEAQTRLHDAEKTFALAKSALAKAIEGGMKAPSKTPKNTRINKGRADLAERTEAQEGGDHGDH